MNNNKKSILGSMVGKAEVVGDIVQPLDVKWEAKGE